MSNTARSNSKTSTDVQKAAMAVGAIFVLVGILGFVPGITSPYGDLELFGHKSGAKLLGLFEVSVLHNVVHLLLGVVGLAMARTWSSARTYLLGGGAIYLVLFVYGLLVDEKSKANFVPLNSADNVLHLGLGVGMIALGLLLSKDRNQHTAGRTV